MFGFLTGVSAWWWIVAGLAIGALEMLSFTYVLVWLGLAALTVGLWLFVHPGLSGDLQVTLFAVLALAFTVAGRLAVRRFAPATVSDRPQLNRRADRLVGRPGRAVGPGEIEVDGEHWRARAPDGQPLRPGAALMVTGADGATLLVGPPASP